MTGEVIPIRRYSEDVFGNRRLVDAVKYHEGAVIFEVVSGRYEKDSVDLHISDPSFILSRVSGKDVKTGIALFDGLDRVFETDYQLDFEQYDFGLLRYAAEDLLGYAANLSDDAHSLLCDLLRRADNDRIGNSIIRDYLQARRARKYTEQIRRDELIRQILINYVQVFISQVVYRDYCEFFRNVSVNTHPPQTLDLVIAISMEHFHQGLHRMGREKELVTISRSL